MEGRTEGRMEGRTERAIPRVDLASQGSTKIKLSFILLVKKYKYVSLICLMNN